MRHLTPGSSYSRDRFHQRCQLAIEILEDRTTPTTFASAGFVDQQVASGFTNNTAMDFSPVGELWVVEENTGLIKIVRNNGTVLTVTRNAGGTATPIPLQPDGDNGERGLLGIAFPNAATGIAYDGLGPNTDYVYVYYTKPTTGSEPFDAIELRHNRVSRFTVIGAGTNDPRIDLASEQVILEIEPENEDGEFDEDGSDNHNGGAIHFSPNGKLFVAIGDHNYDNVDGAGHVSQILTSRFGKLLRLDPDGTNPNDNPFYNGNETNARGAIWALGLRNPFTFNIHPTTGRIYVNDVGEGTWEEINDVGDADTPPTSGTVFNGGWAGSSGVSAEGFETIPFTGFTISNGVYTNPIEAYRQPGTPSGNVITGGVFYAPTNNQFGASFVDRYFFADFGGRWIRLFDPATPGSLGDPSTSAAFADVLDGANPVDLAVDSAGNLYYSAHSGQIRRISRNNAEIAVSFTGTNIADNDTTPSVAEGTDFGNVLIGTFADRQYTITNSGTSSLFIGNIFVSGAGYALQAPPGVTSIAAGGTTTFTVRFTPSVAGAASGRVYFHNNDSADATNEAFFNFDLTGTGSVAPVPEITVADLGGNNVGDGSAASAANGTAFGNVAVGGTLDRTFRVTNNGTAELTLTIDAGSVTGTGFTLQSGAGVFNLAPAATTDFVVRFAPAAPGAVTGAVSFVNNDSDENPFNFGLSGAGVVPEIAVSGNGQDIADGDSTPSVADHTSFGIVMIGSFLDRTYTIQNSGGATLTIGTVTVTGAGFSLQTTPAGSVAAGGSTTFVVRFTPAAVGEVSGTVSFGNHDGDENPFNFSIAGTGRDIQPSRVGVFRAGVGRLDGSGDGVFGTGDWRIPRFDGENARPLVGDWNGDGFDDIGTYRSDQGRFRLDSNGDGAWNAAEVQYVRLDGATGGTPLVGDWDGDGDDDIGLFRGGSRTFRLYVDGTLFQTIAGLGAGTRGNQPLVGDWDGDDADEIGLFRAKTGTFTLDYTGDQTDVRTYTNLDGRTSGKAVVGDWDGDGFDSVGLFRKGSGQWTLDVNGNGVLDVGTDGQFTRLDGQTGGTPLVGDWDGDGIDTVGLFRGTSGRFILDVDGDGVFDETAGDLSIIQFGGQTGGKPVIGRWNLGPQP